MDDSNPRGSILPCTHREAYRQSTISHLDLFIRGLEHLLTVSRGQEQAKLEELVRVATALRDEVENL